MLTLETGLGRGERHHVRFVAHTWRRSLPRSGRGRCDDGDDVLAARGVFAVKALGRPGEAEIGEYLDPWTDPRVARSWLTLAGAAENRYTQEMLPGPGPIQEAEALGVGRG